MSDLAKRVIVTMPQLVDAMGFHLGRMIGGAAIVAGHVVGEARQIGHEFHALLDSSTAATSADRR